MADDLVLRHDDGRVRVLTLNRPSAKNAFSNALYAAMTTQLTDAAADHAVAVVVVTGAPGAFSAGADLFEMAAQVGGGGDFGPSQFPAYVDALIDFPKPLLCAVNGLAVGIGATMLALVDLVVMADDARVRCPFTRLGVAPEAASSASFPMLLGRQQATWALLSSEWLSAEECVAMGLAVAVVPADRLMDETMRRARILAAKPISSLVESKAAIVAPYRDALAAARERENDAFRVLLGGPANVESLRAFAERREPDFTDVDDSPVR